MTQNQHIQIDKPKPEIVRYVLNPAGRQLLAKNARGVGLKQVDWIRPTSALLREIFAGIDQSYRLGFPDHESHDYLAELMFEGFLDVAEPINAWIPF